jgi:membrane fusion protein, multidrug efflux system
MAGQRWSESPFTWLLAVGTAAMLAACNRGPATPPANGPVNVTTVTIVAHDEPIVPEFVAQTQSSQSVNIQARVAGFLDHRVYTEGSIVKAGQVLFLMDRKPFQAQVDANRAALTSSEAAMQVAEANLARTKPLAAQQALSQKDLDDATGQYEQSRAAVEQARAQLQQAELDLSYTTITSPVDGVSSYAAVADGTYLSTQNSQLTTISVLSPMWVNFSLSENEMARIRRESRAGRLRMPSADAFEAELVMVDGTVFPYTGRITFTDPSYNSDTGTFLVRVSVPNPQGILRPNQYVRVRVKGATVPNAILVPQRAVQQGARGHFVWVVDKDGKAQMRPIEVGEWSGDNWFVMQGLSAGETVIVEGTLRLQPNAPVKAAPYQPPARDAPPVPAFASAAAQPSIAQPGATASAGGPATRLPAGTASATPPRASGTSAVDRAIAGPTGTASADTTARPAAAVFFTTGSAALDATAQGLIATLAGTHASDTRRFAITGYTDPTGTTERNVDLARRRAVAVRDALTTAGVDAARIDMRPPRDVEAAGNAALARRVDLFVD